MAKVYFITGTDTEVGKTWVTCAWARDLVQQGYTVAAIKPVVCGVNTQGNYDDLCQLAAVSSEPPKGSLQACYRYLEARAPHLAAQALGQSMTLAGLDQWWQQVMAAYASVDIILLEGAGGWLLPLNDQATLADWVVQQQFPVVCVVGARLGCLNHSLLTALAIERMGGVCVGWVANQLDANWQDYTANVLALKRLLPPPYLGSVSFGQERLCMRTNASEVTGMP
jgi:dethiobiotin synthetase